MTLGSNDILPIVGITRYPFTDIAIFPYGSLAAVAYGVMVAYSVFQHQLLDVHLTLGRSAAYLVRFVFLVMIAVTRPDERATPWLAAYTAAKHGVRGLVRTLAVELRAQGSPVTVALVAPGPGAGFRLSAVPAPTRPPQAWRGAGFRLGAPGRRRDQCRGPPRGKRGRAGRRAPC